jgi:hypothetical protein
LVLINYLH